MDIFEELDLLEKDGNYKGMAELVLGVPAGERSAELSFALISALINMKDYRSTVAELRRLFPECKEPSELAQIYYYSGYAVSELRGNPVLGLSLLKEALAADPKDELGLEIEQECRDRANEIDSAFVQFGELCEGAAGSIIELCASADGGTVLEGRELADKLSFLHIFRHAPGLTPSSDSGDKVLDDDERAALVRWLDKGIGVRDYESMTEMFRSARSFNYSNLADDVLGYIKGKPRFDPDILDSESRYAFNTYAMFIRCFVGYLPPSGVLGWDLAKRIAVARFAFAAGVISESDYINITEQLLNAAKSFDGPKEFLLSLVYGSALAAFDAENLSPAAAINALNLTMPEILKCELPGSVWIIK